MKPLVIMAIIVLVFMSFKIDRIHERNMRIEKYLCDQSIEGYVKGSKSSLILECNYEQYH